MNDYSVGYFEHTSDTGAADFHNVQADTMREAASKVANMHLDESPLDLINAGGPCPHTGCLETWSLYHSAAGRQYRVARCDRKAPTSPPARTHLQHIDKVKPARPCTAHDITFGGGCFNCGWEPPAKPASEQTVHPPTA